MRSTNKIKPNHILVFWMFDDRRPTDCLPVKIAYKQTFWQITSDPSFIVLAFEWGNDTQRLSSITERPITFTESFTFRSCQIHKRAETWNIVLRNFDSSKGFEGFWQDYGFHSGMGDHSQKLEETSRRQTLEKVGEVKSSAQLQSLVVHTTRFMKS